MNNILNARYFVVSILFHLLCFVVFIWANSIQNVNKHFVVYGMTSSTYAYFKPMRMPPKSENSKVVASRIPIKTRPNRAQNVKDPSISKPKPKPVQSKAPAAKINAVKVPQRKDNKDVLKESPPRAEKKLSIPQKKEVKIVKQDVTKVEKEFPKKVEAIADVSEAKEEVYSFVIGEDVTLALEEYQVEMQREIGRVWHPPVGVAKDAECVVLIVPAFGGSVKSFELIKESKIKIYDSSVKLAINRIRFEGKLRELWGKTICITFKQW